MWPRCRTPANVSAATACPDLITCPVLSSVSHHFLFLALPSSNASLSPHLPLSPSLYCTSPNHHTPPFCLSVSFLSSLPPLFLILSVSSTPSVSHLSLFPFPVFCLGISLSPALPISIMWYQRTRVPLSLTATALTSMTFFSCSVRHQTPVLREATVLHRHRAAAKSRRGMQQHLDRPERDKKRVREAR